MDVRNRDVEKLDVSWAADSSTTNGSCETTPSGTLTPAESTEADDREPNWPKGWRPWGCLIGCFFLMWNSWGIVNAFGTFLSYYSQHLFPDTPIPLLNLIGSTQSFVVLLCSFIVGRLLDANHCRKLIAAGAVLITLGTFLLSVVNGSASFGQGNYTLTWFTQGLVIGLGQACFFVSSSQVAATWFVKRKAIAIGIVASGASVAGLVYPMMVKFLITEVGFNDAVRYHGALVGLTTLLSFFLCVPNPKHQFRKPQKWLKTKVWIDTSAFRSGSFNWFSASICFVFLGFYAVFFNLEDWAAYHGFGQKDVPPGLEVSLGNEEVDHEAIRTFWLLCILNISSTAGRVFSACFSEYFGALNIHTIAAGIGSLLLLLLWTFSRTLGTALSFVIIYGAVSGAIIGLPPASIAHILGRGSLAQQSKLGHWTGMMYTAAAVPALVGPVIGGFLSSGSYLPDGEVNETAWLALHLWCGFCLVAAAVCMAVAKVLVKPIDESKIINGVRKVSVVLGGVISRVASLEKEDPDDNKSGAANSSRTQ